MHYSFGVAHMSIEKNPKVSQQQSKNTFLIRMRTQLVAGREILEFVTRGIGQ